MNDIIELQHRATLAVDPVTDDDNLHPFWD